MTTATQTSFSYEQAAAFILPFDKFQGKSIAAAHQADPAYIRWLAKKMTPRNELGHQIKAAASAFLAGPASPQAPATPPIPATNGNGHPSPPPSRHASPPAPEKDEQKKEDHPRIFSIVTNKAILHLEDALGIGKVKFFMVAYVKGQGATATVIHYMNMDDARVLAAKLAGGRLSDKYVEYKGSPTARNGAPLSRVLKIGDMGEKSKRPVVIQVQNGPGQLMGEGAIKPAGEPDAEVTLFLTRHEAQRMGFALQGYLLAWTTVHMMREDAC
jgi:uncharacterized protein (DUF3820 family)